MKKGQEFGIAYDQDLDILYVDLDPRIRRKRHDHLLPDRTHPLGGVNLIHIKPSMRIVGFETFNASHTIPEAFQNYNGRPGIIEGLKPTFDLASMTISEVPSFRTESEAARFCLFNQTAIR